MNPQIHIANVLLTTPRLVLRPWQETDLEDLYAYASVDGVGQMAGWIPHQSIDESRRILSHFIKGDHVFALEHQGTVIGSLGIEEYSERHYPELADFRGREIGYVLSKDYWGQGLMPEAVQAVITWLFTGENLDFILVGHFDWNQQSRRVIEKSGFRRIKSLPYKTRYETEETSVEYILWRKDYADT